MTLSIDSVAPILAKAGFKLDSENNQVHIGDERALISRDKLVLKGWRTSDARRVIIKVGASPAGMREIERERACRRGLAEINRSFQSTIFFYPDELGFLQEEGLCISIIEYVDQGMRFLDRSREEKLNLSLSALHAQERVTVDAVTTLVGIVYRFGTVGADGYLSEFEARLGDALMYFPQNRMLRSNLERAITFFRERLGHVRDHLGFLVHADFVPNNFRVIGSRIYYLDLGAFRFGNRYESWARYLNWLMVWDYRLEAALFGHFSENRGPEHYACLSAMRAFKIGFLIQVYSKHLPEVQHDARLHALQSGRVNFWTSALIALIRGDHVPERTAEEFAQFQESLRSERERRRQKEL